MSVVVPDTPGVGESIRFRKNFLRYDYEVAGSAIIDWLEKRKDVNAKKVGIMASSLGGYYSPRSASMEKRIKACVAWGAIWDYHRIWKKRIDAAFKIQLPSPGNHLAWSFNVKTGRLYGVFIKNSISWLKLLCIKTPKTRSSLQKH